jgi:glucokinase
MADLFLGIDLGGTSVKIGVCDASGGMRGSVSIPTVAERGPEDVIDRMGAAAEKLMEKTGRATACGSGVPGPLDIQRTTLVHAINLKNWTEVRYPELLGKRLGIPTFMENDANCAAWGEYVAGAGRGLRSLVLYTLGTGVGGGIVIDGELWVGASGAAGELGHMTIDPNGPQCGCKQFGCVEMYGSASAVIKRSGKATAKEAFDAARRGDARAIEAIDWAMNGLAIGVANMIHVLHPEIVVLGGGMAAGGDLIFTRVREGVRRRVFAVFLEKIRIEPSQLGDDAGWLGAALWGAAKSGATIREPTAAR